MRVFASTTLSCALLGACAGSTGSSLHCLSTTEPQEKIQIQQSWSEESGPLSEQMIASGTELTAVIRDSCPRPGRISSMIEEFQTTLPTKSGVRSYIWKVPHDTSREQLSEWAEEDECVTLISDSYHDRISDDSSHAQVVDIASLPSDPGVKYQAHLTAIRASEAYDIFYHPQTGITHEIVIAVVDSGISLNHEDLKENLWVNKGEIPGNGKDDDGNGYIDDVYGYNFASNKPSPVYEKTSANGAWQYAHGTKVAGLAAATAGNGRGGIGVMGTAKIMALNNMGKGTSMAQAHTANAIRYAVDNGAHVINLSLGSGTAAGADYKNALLYAASRGVVVLAAAGNGGGRISSNYSAAGQAHGIPGLLAIGNIKASDLKKSSTSNYSTTYVELAAPGTNTSSQGLYTTSPTSTSSYTYFSGTSAAVPVASGAAALAIGLIKSRGYTYTAGDIENLLLESAQKVSGLSSYFKDGNALDIANLARLIDSRYPAQGTVIGGGEPSSPPFSPRPGDGNDNGGDGPSVGTQPMPHMGECEV